MWLAVGWSTVAYGAEYGHVERTYAQKTESFQIRQILGVGQTTNYEAMFWITGILPARERIWIRAFKCAGRLTAQTPQRE